MNEFKPPEAGNTTAPLLNGDANKDVEDVNSQGSCFPISLYHFLNLYRVELFVRLASCLDDELFIQVKLCFLFW